MKVIDLLNKIANEESVPSSIMYEGVVYMKHNYNYTYWDIGEENPLKISTLDLDEEVEIIKEDKEIEEINLEWFKQVDMFDPKSVELALQEEAKIINQLVKAVNELKKGK